jgi:hypothetical protein
MFLCKLDSYIHKYVLLCCNAFAVLSISIVSVILEARSTEYITDHVYDFAAGSGFIICAFLAINQKSVITITRSFRKRHFVCVVRENILIVREKLQFPVLIKFRPSRKLPTRNRCCIKFCAYSAG